MNEFIPHHFEKLKTELLEVSGIKQIIPSDCKRLSVEIYHKTHKQVSETTLKRVFGFAYSQFKPSVFTISAIAEYCGYSGWNNFSEKCGGTRNQNHQQDAGWRSIADHARRVTSFTLQALKNRSGIPYKQTISRKFIDDQLAIFGNEAYTGTILSAPAGYGKTTALCHWVDKKTSSTLYNEGDVILFFNCNVLANASSGHSLNEWLLTLLGVSPGADIHDIDFFEKGPQNGKFYLIIDGLNDCDFKRNGFYQLFGQLIDIVSLYQKHSWFKVVLSMRSSTWINNRHFLANKMHNWFLGFMSDWQQSNNVPLFDGPEIARLVDLIDPFNTAPVIKDVHVYNLSHPLYFQYYYQLHQSRFSLNKINSASIYELTTEHIMQKVYKGRFNDDKVLLLRSLVDNMDLAGGACHIDKLKVHDLLKTYHQAYHELLSTGFLRDTNNTSTLKYDSYIEFNNNNLLEYAIAEKLIIDNNGLFNYQLIAHLNSIANLNQHKLPVIKWCLYKMITGNQTWNIGWLLKAGLTVAERAELILLLGQLIKKQQLHDSLALKRIFSREDKGALFNYFVGPEFIDQDYEQALLVLLRFDLSDRQMLTVKTYLSLIAIIKLDIARLETCLEEIKNIHTEVLQGIPINPLLCLDTIYFYLKFGIIKKEALTAITRFYFNPGLMCQYSNIDDITPVLAIYTLMLCRNHNKTIRFVNALEKVHPIGSGSESFLLNTWIANACISANDKRALCLFDQISQIFQDEGAGYTSFMKLSYYSLKVKILQFKGEYNALFDELKHLVHLCDKENQKMIKVSTIAHLLSNFAFIKEYTGLFDMFYFDFVKTTRNSGCRTESFIVKVASPEN